MVPVIAHDRIDPALVHNLTDAVRTGTGLASCHGGLAASFPGAVKFHFLTAVHWVALPGDTVARYRVFATMPDIAIMQGMGDFDDPSAQYYVLCDLSVDLPATTTFTGDHDMATTGVKMPVVFKRRFGAGPITYSALGRKHRELTHAHEIPRRGLSLAARDPKEILQ